MRRTMHFAARVGEGLLEAPGEGDDQQMCRVAISKVDDVHQDECAGVGGSRSGEAGDHHEEDGGGLGIQ